MLTLYRLHEYESHLRDWKVVKNVRKSEWDYIIPRVSERQKVGKPTVVRVHNIEIQPSRVKKEKGRRERQVTTYHRFAIGES